VPIRVEVAATPAARRVGLMFRKHLDDDAGMLFVMPQRTVHVFWMKNTYVPLDMIFVDEDGTVAGIVQDAKPLTLEGRKVDRPSRYVIEVNAGLTARIGLQAGDRVDLSEVLAHLARHGSRR